MRTGFLCGLPVLAALVLLLCLPRASAAPHVTVGVEGWNTGIRGNINKPKSAGIAFDNLDMGRHWNPNFILALSTPAYWPDIRVEYGLMQSNGNAEFSTPQCVLGYTIEGQIQSQVAIKQARVLFVWHPVHTRMVDLQTGLDLRWVTLNLPVSGSITAHECGASGPPAQVEHGSYSAGAVSWLPSANLGVTVHLPAHFDIFFVGSAAPYASNYIYDFRAGFKYNFASGLTIAAGYRRWRLHLDDDSFSVNGTVDFKGPYAGLYWSF